jgi:hypothetical protein
MPPTLGGKRRVTKITRGADAVWDLQNKFKRVGLGMAGVEADRRTSYPCIGEEH